MVIRCRGRQDFQASVTGKRRRLGLELGLGLAWKAASGNPYSITSLSSANPRPALPSQGKQADIRLRAGERKG